MTNQTIRELDLTECNEVSGAGWRSRVSSGIKSWGRSSWSYGSQVTAGSAKAGNPFGLAIGSAIQVHGASAFAVGSVLGYRS